MEGHRMITATSANTLSSALPPAGAPGASTRLEGGCVVFLNDNWDIDIHASGAVCITALATGQAFMAWGNAPGPGAPPFEFAGYTTLVLADGTKVTLHTAPWDALSALTRPDSVLIVSGSYGVQVQGLNAGSAAALCYVESQDLGWLMDAVVPDGAVVMHNPDGPGLVGDNPEGLWQVLDVPEADGGPSAGFGPLAGPTGHTLLNAGGVMAISFMGAFSRMPSARPFEIDHPPPARTSSYRLPEQEVALQRLVLMRAGGRVQAWTPVHPGVHPSSGAPGCRWPAGSV
jgi:Domain of Unknown Function (DUF1521)